MKTYKLIVTELIYKRGITTWFRTITVPHHEVTIDMVADNFNTLVQKVTKHSADLLNQNESLFAVNTIVKNNGYQLYYTRTDPTLQQYLKDSE